MRAEQQIVHASNTQAQQGTGKADNLSENQKQTNETNAPTDMEPATWYLQV
jgi:hypothetical protein